MAEALRSADSSMVEETLRRIFPINLGSIQMENPRGLVLRLLLTFDQIARELGLADADQFLSERQFSLIATLSRQAQAQAFLLSEGRRFCEAVRQRSLGSSRQAVEKVRHLVRQRCKEGISIKELAGEVFLTSTYLCMLFKQETGETIKDYQTRIRIERAKELLADLKLKTYEVCFEVGYSDPGYFAQTFKRFTGMSPTEYRDRKPGLR